MTLALEIIYQTIRKNQEIFSEIFSTPEKP